MMGIMFPPNPRLLDKVVQRIRSFPQLLGMLRRRDIEDRGDSSPKGANAEDSERL